MSLTRSYLIFFSIMFVMFIIALSVAVGVAFRVSTTEGILALVPCAVTIGLYWKIWRMFYSSYLGEITTMVDIPRSRVYGDQDDGFRYVNSTRWRHQKAFRADNASEAAAILNEYGHTAFVVTSDNLDTIIKNLREAVFWCRARWTLAQTSTEDGRVETLVVFENDRDAIEFRLRYF